MRVRSWVPILAMFTVASCDGPNARDTRPTTTAGQQNEASVIVQRIGLALPATAAIEFAEQIEGQDDAARLIAVMPDKDWQALLATLPASDPQQPPFSPEANFHLGPDEGQWQPGKASGLSTMQLAWKGGAEALNLGVAPAAAGQTRLFVFWHQL